MECMNLSNCRLHMCSRRHIPLLLLKAHPHKLSYKQTVLLNRMSTLPQLHMESNRPLIPDYYHRTLLLLWSMSRHTLLSKKLKSLRNHIHLLPSRQKSIHPPTRNYCHRIPRLLLHSNFRSHRHLCSQIFHFLLLCKWRDLQVYTSRRIHRHCPSHRRRNLHFLLDCIIRFHKLKRR